MGEFLLNFSMFVPITVFLQGVLLDILGGTAPGSVFVEKAGSATQQRGGVSVTPAGQDQPANRVKLSCRACHFSS